METGNSPVMRDVDRLDCISLDACTIKSREWHNQNWKIGLLLNAIPNLGLMSSGR
jgi:hypothetical protein